MPAAMAKQAPYLPRALCNYGPGPARWGWILRLRCADGFPWSLAWSFERTARELGLSWNNEILAVGEVNRWTYSDGHVYVAVVNDPKFAWVVDALRARHPGAELHLEQTWWEH